MKKKIVIALLAIIPSLVFAQEAKFHKNIPWADVLKMASEQNKPIFVDAYTDWCYWCKVMDKKTFTNEEVINRLNEEFIAVKIDAEKGEGINFAAKFKISGYPTVLFFSPKGELVINHAGYLDVEQFLEKSDKAVHDSKPLTSIDGANLNPGFPEFYINSYDPEKRKKVDVDVIDIFLNKQGDLNSEVAWAVMSRFTLSEKYTTHFLNNREEYSKHYGESEVYDKIQSIASSKLRKSIKEKDKELFNQAIEFVEVNFSDEYREETIKNYKLNFHLKTGNWEVFAKIFNPMYKEAHPGQINSYAWDIYENCDNEEVIMMACDWMNLAVEKDESYALIDTYAAILYKAGRLEEAEKTAKTAIIIGEESEEDVKGTIELLDKIKAEK